MTATRQVSDKPLEEPLRFSLDEPVELDVAYCDVVRSREPNHTGPFELRFRGTRQPDGALVRGFIPLLEIEGSMIDAKVIPSAVSVDGMPQTERAFVAVPLVKHALTITKRRKGNGHWWYEVAVRDGAQAQDLAQYLRALRDAGEAALALQAQGYPVGAMEVISIADSLFAVRLARTEGAAR